MNCSLGKFKNTMANSSHPHRKQITSELKLTGLQFDVLAWSSSKENLLIKTKKFEYTRPTCICIVQKQSEISRRTTSSLLCVYI